MLSIVSVVQLQSREALELLFWEILKTQWDLPLSPLLLTLV